MNSSFHRLLLATFLCLIPFLVIAQPFDPEHRIVFQISSSDHSVQSRALSNIVNLQKAYGVDNIEIQVIALGPGVQMLVAGNELIPRIEALQMVDVVFNICGNTLETRARSSGKRLKIIPDVNVVEYGFQQIIKLQEKGYVYLVP